jgi:hemoglobin
MKVIENREDVRVLVHAFYLKIRENDLLGPIFNGHIVTEKWPEHLEKLTDFWRNQFVWYS